MNNFDIRRGDTVRFRKDLTPQDRESIAKFAKRVSKEPHMKAYALKVASSNPKTSTFQIKSSKKTEKKPTYYAVLVTPDNVMVPIQSRFLEVIDRKPHHPLTNMFSDFESES